MKKELEETKNLTNKLESKEIDIKEIRKALKQKQEELSEMTIRKELAEKKLGNVNKDYELTIEKLQRKLEEAQNNFKKKEKEFEKTLDHLQTDIDSLENERGEMREKLKMYSKKVLIEGMSKSTSGTQLSQLATSNTGPSLPAMVRDSPLLIQEINNLKTSLEHERNEKLRIQCMDLKKKLNGLKPLPNFKKNNDDKLNELLKEATVLKQVRFSLVFSVVTSIVSFKNDVYDEASLCSDLAKSCLYINLFFILIGYINDACNSKSCRYFQPQAWHESLAGSSSSKESYFE